MYDRETYSYGEFVEMKVLAYTAIFGSYDSLQNVCNLHTTVYNSHTTFLCITDCISKEECKEKGWNRYFVEPSKMSPTKANRFYKFNVLDKNHPIHKYKCDIIVYLDTNKWITNMGLLLYYCQELHRSNKSISISNHWGRTTVLQEIQELIKLSIISKDIALGWYADCLLSGFKDNYGLYCASVQIRKNNTAANDLLWQWWLEFKEFPYRDQILLPYILWRYNYMNAIMTINVDELLSFVEHKPHLKGQYATLDVR